MKKIIVGTAIILVIGGFVVFQKLQSNELNETTEEGNTLTVNTPSSQTAVPAGSIKYKDGTYTGAVGSASQYGDVQVKAVIKQGKLVDIIYLQFPTGGGHTAEVTAMAEPLLKQEAITAQSANIDIVSGATQDTEGFIQSLQSALDQAKV